MKKYISRAISLILLISLFLLSSCSDEKKETDSSTSPWIFGFGSADIPIPLDSDEPLYIAGYNNGVEMTGVNDLQRANAVWIEKDGESVLLMGIDCVGLASDTVETIRDRLGDFSKETGCDGINIFSTHTHAGIDTLGLWGHVATDGKNKEFMESLISSAVVSAHLAYQNRADGELYYGKTMTVGLQEDSRKPNFYDPNMYQLRFAPHDSSRDGIRMIFFAAHAESLRGDNTIISRDFPGVLSDEIAERCGDSVLFVPGAIGGLIMTPVLTKGDFDAFENMKLTGKKLADAALSISPKDEQKVEGSLTFASEDVELPLDNTLYMYYKFLGILGNKVSHGRSETGYVLHTTVGALRLGDVTLALIPGEIFPELVTGKEGETLRSIALSEVHEKLLVVGLCNDEIGYIVPENDYLVDEKLPYFNSATDKNGEDHYEETNSVGKATSAIILNTFKKLLKKL